MIRASDLEHWEKLCAAFDTLVELDPDARAQRLAEIGAADPAARRALEELLDADANSSSGLGRLDAIFGTADPVPGSPRSDDLDVLKLVGQTVGHFRIVEPLAAGGMGVVYRAVDAQLGRPVALKFPLPGLHLDGHARERFLREARAAGALDHPNVCSIYEAGETADGHLFLAMPLYDGETLKARIARAGPLPITDALAFALQVARGLQAAHRAGIVHRDLKPANAIILGDGALKILDFGVARVGDVALTKSHQALGTVSYMAPEQIRSEQLDGRADLWALGVVLYEMLTGRRPFEGEHDIAIAHGIVHSNPLRPSALRPEIWPALDALVLGLLAREPGRRRASAEAVAIEVVALQSRVPPPRARRWRLPFTARRRRRPLVWAAAVTLIVTAGGITAWQLRAGPAGGSAEPRIVAVLPFEELSGSDHAAYLGVAIADEIATRLSRLSGVAVPVARDIGAGAVVRGSVQRTGDDVRLQVELFDATGNRPFWSREYRGPASTVLTLQRSATDGIVAALDLDVTRSERAGLARVETASADVYDLYLRGRAAELNAVPGNVEPLQQAQSYYARARERDPDFAAARASLARSHLALAGNDRTSARRDQARIEAEAALRLEPGMPEAHEALASYWLLQNDIVKAIAELELALAGRPNAPHLYGLLGANLSRVGRREEAAAALERATRLDPRNKLAHQQAATTYGRMRRYEDAIAHWDQVIAIDSARDPTPQMIRGFAYLRHGNVDSLEAAINRIPLGLDARGMTTYAHYTLHSIKRRYAAALASLDSARVAISFDVILFRPVSLMRAQTLERMGNLTSARVAYEAARRLLEDSVAALPGSHGRRVALGLAYAGLRRRADAMREARTATELVPLSENSSGATAAMGGAIEIYAQLGEADAALELIELLLAMPAGREISVPLLRLDPTFDPLRSDPRFEALLARFSRN